MERKNRIHNSLKVSFLEGIFSSCAAGLVNDYFTPYALVALNAGTQQIGAMTAIPFLASSLAQLKAADLSDKLSSRKRTLAIFVFLNAAMFVPIILTPYLFRIQPVSFLIFFFTCYTVFNSITGSVWPSLMAEYVPASMRGRYAGWRGRIMTVVTIVSSLYAGLILQRYRNNVLRGFLIIFAFALACRLISWYSITRLYEPPLKIDKNAYFNFWDFLRRLRHSNFARFALFLASLHFAVNIASPFFSVFMLRDLKFNYFTYTLLVTTVTLFGIVTVGRWGKIADEVGNVKVLKVTSFLIATLPLWWIINQNPVYLIFAQALSGFAWTGFNLCAANFVLDAVTAQKRIRCVAYLSVLVGAGVSLSSLLGGYLANILPVIFNYRILTLFLLASILRFCVVFFLGARIKEVRQVPETTTQELFFYFVGKKFLAK